jgi:hypothetical protein
VAAHRRRGADEDERGDAIREVERQQLRQRPAHRHADHVGGRDAEGIEHARRVGDEIVRAVPRPPGRIRDRPAGVAVVVADHEPPALREQAAELLVPPQHGAAHAHEQQHRRVGRVAERLGAELDAVRFDDHQT